MAQADASFARLERGRRVIEHKDGTTSEKPLYAANTRRIHRAIVAGVLQQAVLHKAIPSNPVRELLVTRPNGQGRRVFAASSKPDAADKWRRYRLTAPELPVRMLDRLAELDTTDRG